MRGRFALRPTAFTVAALLLFLLRPLALLAQDAAGHWSGTIKLPAAEATFDIDLVNAGGTWSGDITIPQQGAVDQKFTTVKVEGRQVTFVIATVPGEPTFVATLSDDGRTLNGTLTQRGQSFPFALSRGDPESIEKKLAGLDPQVEAAMKGLLVPGMAVGIVKDGKVVWMKGYGYADVAQKKPVTPQTLFAIGSATKAFTTFAMEKLVEDGKLDLDKPSALYLPGLKLYDEYVTAHITPRDMVTHRSGLPRHDLAWYNNADVNGEALFARLAQFEPNKELRQTFQYNNIMFVTAGHLVSRITGKPWERAIDDLVLQPLGMRNTNFSVKESQKAAEYAFPYGEAKDTVSKLNFRDISNVGPAGSINSNIVDMLRWAALQAGDGTLDGKRLIGKALLDEMHTPQMVIGALSPDPMLSPQSYGLGWFIDTYRGHFRVHHGGNIDGFSALVSLFPHDRTGIVVLTNKNATALPELTVRHIADRIFDLSQRDWYGEAVRRRTAQLAQARTSEQRARAERVTGTKPAYPLAAYAAEYEHPGYGTMTIRHTPGANGGTLAMRLNAIDTPLEHWHYEVFSGTESIDPTFANFKIQFISGLDGQISGVSAAMEPNVEAVIFTRKPDAKLRDVAYIAKFAGKYQQAGGLATVELKGDHLEVSIPGQPTYVLVPARDNTFTLKGMNGFRMQFTVDAGGKVTEAVFKQPNGIFPAKRVE